MCTDPEARIEEAYNVRVQAAELARGRGAEPVIPNGEEQLYPTLIASFTKGLCHDDMGIVADTSHFDAFVSACNTGDIDEIAALPLGPPRDEDGIPTWRSCAAQNPPARVRGWESMAAGRTYDLQGPDAQSVVMPPAPLLNSDELVAEMAEVYLMALTRDIPISRWSESEEIGGAINFLNSLPWFSEPATGEETCAEIARRRGPVTLSNLFRGLLPGSLVGPYQSQFLVCGSDPIGDSGSASRSSGIVQYGALSINQRVRVAKACQDFMTSLDYFLDVQDGAALSGREEYEDKDRFVATLRDLATYVHYDALYEAYLNACIVLLANGAPLDPGLPFVGDDSIDKQQGFALYGGPHILTLVTEVSTRALKAVRFSKFNVHRRARPESIGGLIHLHKTTGCFPEVDKLVTELEPILEKVARHNREINENNSSGDEDVPESYLLPMAFSEGSPNHPSYGSGHAAVAGACVTILKAFFKEDHVLENEFLVDDDGDTITDRVAETGDPPVLTVGGELEKLADNIAIGRNAAGVHYFSDQWESLLLGEKIAIGILEETRLTYREKFHFSFTKFDGELVQI